MNNGLYSFRYSYENASLIRSVVKLLKHVVVSSDYKQLQFRASIVCRLPPSLDLEQTLQLVYCLATQIKHLVLTERKCFYTIDKEHIYMIDGVFVYMFDDHLMDIDQTDNIKIYGWVDTEDEFLSPELRLVPKTVHYKTIYYSLALIVKRLHPSWATSYKLSQLLRRCMCECPQERSIIYV
jgi:hypothetical protein